MSLSDLRYTLEDCCTNSGCMSTIALLCLFYSVISEEYVISSSGNVGPSILELRKMPKSSSLIIGHDGAGGFCLW